MGKHGVPKAAFQKSPQPRQRIEPCVQCDKEPQLDGDPDKFGKNCRFFAEKGKRSVGK